MHRLGWWMPVILATMAVPSAISAQTKAADGIVVEGRKAIDRQDVARELPRILAVTGNAQIARWHRSVCVTMVGLLPEQSQFFLARLQAVGAGLGLSVRDCGKCEGRAVILFTDDWTALSAKLRAGRSSLPNRMSAPSDAMPIRWVPDADLRGADGEAPMAEGRPDTPKWINVRVPSRLGAGTRMDLQGMAILIDASRLRSASNGALASYLAMVLIGNVRQDYTGPSAPSILNLFADPARVPADGELSDWDRRYLAALYAGVGNLSVDRKRAEMIAAMTR